MMTKITLHPAPGVGAGALPPELLERIGIAPGESAYAVDRPGGVLLTPDPNFGAAMQAFDRARKQYSETFRRLAE
jgi:hypothetical protein